MNRILACSLVALAFFQTPTSKVRAEDLKFVDGIVAVVSGAPITLSELSARLQPPRHLSLSEAASDPEARYAIDQMIQELLIREEAKARRLASVDPSDVESYMDEVAKRNGLDRSALERALIAEGVNVENYRNKIEVDILRSRITAAISRDGAGVTNEEIDSFAKDHPEFSESGNKVKLRQILIATTKEGSSDTRSEEEALALIEKVKEGLSDGKEFAELANKFSDGTEGQDGGSLGVLVERDLSSEIQDAVMLLKPGEVSDVVKTASGYHLFLLEERFSEEQDKSDDLRGEIRKILEHQKMEEKLSAFFNVDLYKKHHVEKKI